MRGDTRRELARLLDGGGLGRELLGLVVTAGGGLSGEDLAALADEPVGEIERILHAVAGRSFTSRDLPVGNHAGVASSFWHTRISSRLPCARCAALR